MSRGLPVPITDHGVLYFIESCGFIKVGVTRNLAQRMDTIERLNPSEVRLLLYRTEHINYLFRLERRVHELLKGRCVRWDWFAVSLQEAQQALRQAQSDIRKMRVEDRARFRTGMEAEKAKRLKAQTRAADVRPT